MNKPHRNSGRITLTACRISSQVLMANGRASRLGAPLGGRFLAPRRFRLHWTGLRSVVAIFLGVALVAVLWQVVLLAIPVVLPEPATAVFGTIEIGRWVETALFRREITVAVPMAGTFRPLHPAGERIARRGVIGEVKGARGSLYTVKAPTAGLVSYTVDGREESLTPTHCLVDPRQAFHAAKESRPQQSGRGAVRSGQTVAKLIDDREMYLLYRSARDQAPPRVGERLWARDQETLIPLFVAKVVSGDEIWIVLKSERFPLAWLDRRFLNLYLVSGRYTGTIVPRRFIHQQDGRYGINVVVNGRSKFTAVELLGQDRRQAVVRGLREGSILLPR